MNYYRYNRCSIKWVLFKVPSESVDISLIPFHSFWQFQSTFQFTFCLLSLIKCCLDHYSDISVANSSLLFPIHPTLYMNVGFTLSRTIYDAISKLSKIHFGSLVSSSYNNLLKFITHPYPIHYHPSLPNALSCISAHCFATSMPFPFLPF